MPNRVSLIILSLLQIFYLISLVIWVPIYLSAGWMLDNPAPAHEQEIKLIIGLILSYPIAVLIFSIIGWVSYFRSKFKPAIGWMSIPLLIIALWGVTLILDLGS